jgi:hypothetical protein
MNWPLLIDGGRTVKALSLSFLMDFEPLEGSWSEGSRQLADKNPQAYFNGAVALARVIKWETDDDQGGGAMTPDEIIAKMEQRVGPEGRRLFERFLRDVNMLQAKQLARREKEREGNGSGT